MNKSVTEIDNWLVAAEFDDQVETYDVWEPGFKPDRQIVISKFGPYKKTFLRPEGFVKRFYHTVYSLPIDEWQSVEQIKLYDNFCTIDITLDVRFQATFIYAQNNMEILTELSEHIKNAYYDLSNDIIHRELLNLPDGSWVRDGLDKIENKICSSVSEMLIMQNIQSQVTCLLKPSFEEFPDVQFAKESVYLSVLKKSFEFKDEEKELIFQHQQVQESKKIDYKRQQLQQLNEVAELERQKQAIQAENKRQYLEDKIQHQAEQFTVSQTIHRERVEHNHELKKMTLLAELKQKAREKQLQREHEQQEKDRWIQHKKALKERELQAEIAEYKHEQKNWRLAKDNTHAEDLDLKHRQKQLEFDADVGYKKRYEEQRLALQEESYTTRKNADLYLKREIELLELEKQRLELKETIKGIKDKTEDDN